MAAVLCVLSEGVCVTHLFHLIEAFAKVLIQVRLHPGHNAFQFNSLVQQLPVVLQQQKIMFVRVFS